MKPIELFKDACDRAETLVKIYNGLYNRRQKKIRSDWKQQFAKIMHWPKKAQIQRVDTPEAVIILRDGAILQSSTFNSEELHDLLRSAVMLAVSALDRYVHERVVKNIISALKAPTLNKQQEEFVLPVKVAMQISQRIAASKNKNMRPSNEIRNAIQDSLHKRPFQAWRDIEYAFQLIGIDNLSGKLQTAYGTGDMKAIKNRLNGLVHRRNLIAHEGDIKRTKRAGKLTRNEISTGYVQSEIDFLRDFVNKLEAVT
jgi:hypothetical protein